MKKHEYSVIIKILLISVGNLVTGAPTDGLKIFGGQDAAPGQFPYMVSIQNCRESTCKHECGGSVLAPSWIITAGHCACEGPQCQVVAGILNMSETSEWRQTVEVEKAHVHEKYLNFLDAYDISLLQLKEPLTYNDRVQPIPLPKSNWSYSGEAVVSGWGRINGNYDANIPDTLQFQKSTVPKNDECMDLIAARMHGQTNPFDVTRNVCTDNAVPDRGICSGDSGSPLVAEGVVIGLASWAFTPCGQAKAPSAFTRVSYFVDWIHDHMNSTDSTMY
ncbi:unnamed protein product [Phaedon cochleariae]|uniref:Peptidase S1 domain-containing protein n=1 Tax=Phaedon cochleariae TaxID=80249 RepID=A0A9P0DQH4_PHACE|nr:unnamed protein product [Phaedon cochleariae]